jgi:hypothetical protein
VQITVVADDNPTVADRVYALDEEGQVWEYSAMQETWYPLSVKRDIDPARGQPPAASA